MSTACSSTPATASARGPARLSTGLDYAIAAILRHDPTGAAWDDITLPDPETVLRLLPEDSSNIYFFEESYGVSGSIDFEVTDLSVVPAPVPVPAPWCSGHRSGLLPPPVQTQADVTDIRQFITFTPVRGLPEAVCRAGRLIVLIRHGMIRRRHNGQSGRFIQCAGGVEFSLGWR